MTHLIACEMLRDELELAMETTGIQYPTTWLDKGLHDTPDKLRRHLQDTIDSLPDCDTVLLAMALCGGAVEGITGGSARLAIPRFDDCIRMLLSLEPGMRNAADIHSLYYTREWLTSDKHITGDQARYVQRYGEKKAKKYLRLLLANYTTYRMIATGAYDLAAIEEQARADAATLELAYDTQPGSIRILEKLLRQEFDGEFLVLQPGQSLTQRMFLDL